MNTGTKVKKIIFCDTLPAIDADKDILYIALKPLVYAYLREKGVSVQNTLPYFKNDSHEKCLKRSEILMGWIRTNSGFSDIGDGVQDAYREMLIFWLRLAVHYCLWQIEIIVNAIETHQPAHIGVSMVNRKYGSNLYVQPEECFLADLAANAAQARNIACDGANLQPARQTDPAGSNSRGDIKSQIDYFVRYAKFRLFEIKVRFKILFTGKKPVIFAARSYHMDKYALRLKKEAKRRPIDYLKLPLIADPKILDLAVKILGKNHRQAIDKQRDIIISFCDKIRKETDLFSYRGISFAGLISDKVNKDLSPFILAQTLWSFMLRRQLSIIKPALVVSNASRGDDMLLAELCLRNRIKNVLVSHGSHVYPNNEYEKIEWGEHGKQFLSSPVSHIAMPTPLSEGYLKGFPSKAGVIKTGPLIWGTPVDKEASKRLFDKLVNGKFSFGKTKVILHAGTPKASNSLRLFVYETPDEYIQALSDLVNAVKDIPNTLLVIRFRPLPEISLDTLKSLLPASDKVILCTEGSFLDVLGIADLLVSFSSTSIDEALQNRIPVLLYGGRGRYRHTRAYEIGPDNIMEAAAVYYAEKVNLTKTLTKILNLDIPVYYRGVFDEYIYPEEKRSSLAELLI